MNESFQIAIVDTNILSAIGLQQIIGGIIPSAAIRIFISFDELQTAGEESFVHYFVASRLYFEHTAFFRRQAHRTIVLVHGELQILDVPTLNVCQSEQMLVKTVLAMFRHAGRGAHPMMQQRQEERNVLSSRETEIAILLAKGLINKEIADRLHISINTVITHRKNIMEKLHAASIANVIIFAVMNGLVEVGEL